MHWHPALWQDIHATSMPWPPVPRVFPPRGRHASATLAFTALVQGPASRYSRGRYCSTLRKQSGRSEAAQTLLFSPLRRAESKETVAELVVCSARIFVCDPLIENLCGVVQGEQRWWGARCSVLPMNLKARPPDTACCVAWVRDDPSHGGKERDEVLNDCVFETDSLIV